jgi:hypothetical protein
MESLITVAVLLAMIALGAFVIHLLNNQHAQRIAAFHYHRLLPVAPGQEPDFAATRGREVGPLAGHGARRDHRDGVRSARRDHRDGGRGRLRPHGKQVRSRNRA